MSPARLTRPILLAVLLTFAACSTHRAPVMVGHVGLSVATAVGQLQVALQQLQQTGVLPARDALVAQEALLRVNAHLAILPPLLRVIDTASDPTASDLERALAALQAASRELSIVVAGVPVSDATARVLTLVQTAQQTITTLTIEIAKIQGATAPPTPAPTVKEGAR